MVVVRDASFDLDDRVSWRSHERSIPKDMYRIPPSYAKLSQTSATLARPLYRNKISAAKKPVLFNTVTKWYFNDLTTCPLG
ncbi:hypothetical protein PUN28_008568 [Cardiocondyla obscurior]|uniref:Uncharacterized protein n=1 Tax=Cardiocondyla obscurior TaxID=286306 RepID=A0AAW2FY82_9HYME